MKKILVVEDNSLNMKLMYDLLTAHGYDVLQAGEGMQGIEMARTSRPDLILLDIQLPDVSGLQVSQWLKQDDDLSTIPVIAVTAFAMKGDEEKIRAAGCDAYIAKPIAARNLLESLRSFLG